jgi:hypothetical protein
VQQIVDTFQCLDGSLNAYLDKCLQIIALFDDFTMQHISRDENTVASDLAQQASDFHANRGKFNFLEKLDVSVCQTGQSDFQPCTVRQSVLLNQVQQNRTVQFLKSKGPKFPGLQAKQVKQ